MPEYAHQNDNRPELGFVSLGDYLGANKGPLDAGYQQDFTQAHALGDTLQSQLGMTEQEARNYSGQHQGTAATAAQTPDYNNAATSAMQTQEMGRKFGSQSALAGSATDPTNPAASFNAALMYGAHGTDYGTLSGYLGGFGTGGPDASLAKGNREGLDDYLTPKPAAPYDPEHPASLPSERVYPAHGAPGQGPYTQPNPHPPGRRPIGAPL